MNDLPVQLGFTCHRITRQETMQRFLQVIEAILDLGRLDREITRTGKVKPVDDWQDLWTRMFAESHEPSPLLTNGREGSAVIATLSLSLSNLSPAGLPFHTVTISFPARFEHKIEECMARGGDAVGAVIAGWTPHTAGEHLRMLLFNNRKTPWTAEVRERYAYLELPQFRAGAFNLDTIVRPAWLDWLNYWSPETCGLIGFPEASKDEEILKRSYQTESGAWLVKLTDEPLDLEREDHRNVVKWAYERFDRVGARLREA